MIPEIQSRYKEIELISKGANGEIYKAVDIINNKKVIIKKVLNKYMLGNIDKFRKLILKLSCDQIVKVMDINVKKDSIYFIEQYIEGNSLEQYIRNSNLCLHDFFNIAQDICKACIYLKNNNLVHMDIKPSNIIYNENDKKAILLDIDYIYFSINENKYKFIGTLNYSAPEQIMHNDYSPNSDIYSFGMVLYELVEGMLPFTNNREGIINKIKNTKEISFQNTDILPQVSDKLIHLITKMLDNDPNKRISAEDTLKSLQSLFLEVENLKLLNTPIKNKNDITVGVMKDNNLVTFSDTTEILAESVIITSESEAWTPADWEKYNFKRINKNKDDINIIKDNDNPITSYQKQLINEYDNILLQAKISFILWVSSFIVCYAIIIIAIVLICLGRYYDALIVNDFSTCQQIDLLGCLSIAPDSVID